MNHRWKVETDNFSKSYSYDHGFDLQEKTDETPKK